MIVLVNDRKYGGGGIFNLYATVAADNGFADYLWCTNSATTSPASPTSTTPPTWPTSPAPASSSRGSPTSPPPAMHPKWADLVDPRRSAAHAVAEGGVRGTRQRETQAERRELRTETPPEEEIEALFRREQKWSTKLLGEAEYAGKVGAFEGANYSAHGYYRPQTDCIMFTRDDVGFCRVCRRAIERVIDLYAPAP